MSRSGNALWVGAIVIVAALTAVELMSSRDQDDAAESAKSSMDTVASSAPMQPQAGHIASGRITEADHEDEFANVIDPDIDFDPASYQAPDLIVDLDHPEAYITPGSDDTHQDAEAQQQITETTEQAIAADIPATGIPDEPEAAIATTAIAETATQSPETQSPVVSIDEAEDLINGLPATEEPVAEHSHAITQHLADAERAIKELRLTTPEGNNAYEHYQAILAKDPDNTEAKAGMQKIIDMYIYFVEKAITDDKAHTAKVYLQRAEHLQPGSEKLKQLRAKLY
ncbi:MAG: hypothetical protein KF908_00340 [Nitrosomonas sp.]|nr:hypothetical protein [Nitrosomonas sp.]MCW5607908.1 hypothetical protein [Nitrosomonas sp.]